MVGGSGSSSSRLLTLEIVFFNFSRYRLLLFCFPFLFPVSSIDLLKWFIHNTFSHFFWRAQSFLFKNLPQSPFSFPRWVHVCFRGKMLSAGATVWERRCSWELTSGWGIGTAHSLPPRAVPAALPAHCPLQDIFSWASCTGDAPTRGRKGKEDGGCLR